jgi:hypothetical protein
MNIKKFILLSVVIAGIFFIFLNVVSATTSPQAGAKITFEKNIAPILESKCQQCHSEGGSAPMSLVTYNETRPWARAIKEKVIARDMPPFFASGPAGYYENDLRLTQEEINMISQWADTGAPKGDPVNHPERTVGLADNQREKPNLVLKPRMPYTIKAGATDDYQVFAFDYVFAQDTWIRGMDVHPGNRAVVHHVGIYILPDSMQPGADGRIESAAHQALLMGAQLIYFWNPGSNARMYKDGTAMMIPKGSRLGIQVHYAPTTKNNLVDHTSLNIYYANGVVNKMIHALYGGTNKINIPPWESNYQLTNYQKFKTDALILLFSAHMHLRGKSFVIRLLYPDGRKETVFDLPRFNFYWQRGYALAKPLLVPKGTVAEYVAVWDNSQKNPANPNPGQEVHFGFGTKDEMMGATIAYVIPEEELNIPVKDGIRIDNGKATGNPAQK